jgi:hypothetical protein
VATSGSFWGAVVGLSALMILAYLALEHSGGVRQVGQSVATDVGAVSQGASRLVGSFQGRG